MLTITWPSRFRNRATFSKSGAPKKSVVLPEERDPFFSQNRIARVRGAGVSKDSRVHRPAFLVQRGVDESPVQDMFWIVGFR